MAKPKKSERTFPKRLKKTGSKKVVCETHVFITHPLIKSTRYRCGFITYPNDYGKLLYMQAKESNSFHIVSDPKAAEVLMDERQLRYFSLFLSRELTVSEAAQKTGSSIKTMHARVTRFHRYNLLEVTRKIKRKGRDIKVYSSVADVFFVPVVNSEGLEESFLKTELFWEREVVRGVLFALDNPTAKWGTRFYRGGDGVLKSSLAISPTEDINLLKRGAPACLSTIHDSVYLDFEAAKDFQNELSELLERYVQKSGSQRYIVKVGFAPLPDKTKHIP